MSELIKIRVTPKSKKNDIIEFNDGYKVKLTAPPIGGKANKALIEFLAKHFKLKKSQVSIVSGEKSKDKIIELETK